MTCPAAPELLTPPHPRPPLAPSEASGRRSESDHDSSAGTPHAQGVLAAAREILNQGDALLLSLTPDVYAAEVPVVFNASIGRHYRHCLDHFGCLLDGFGRDLVDYDRRARDPRLEREPGFARVVTQQLLRRLEALPPDALGAPISARCEVSYLPGDAPVTQSTLGRELVYAIAHGIHHYAIISVMARLLNAPMPAHFGVAPSTVTHQERVADHGVRCP